MQMHSQAQYLDSLYCCIQEKAVARKSPARSRSRPKSSSPKAKRTPARSRRSRTQANDEEEQTEQKEQEEDKEEEDKELEEEEDKQKEEEDKDSDKEEEAAADEGQTGAGAEPVDEGESGGDVKPVEEEMVTESDRPDTAAAAAEADLQTQPTTTSEADNSVCHTEVSPHVDRKRKFDEIEDESDNDDDEEGDTVKMLKVCEEDSDEKTATVEAPIDGEMTSADEPTAESKLSLPLSSETDIEDDYVVITPDDVPPVDSDEVMNTAAKMVPDLSSAVSNDTLDAVDIPNPILCREYVANPTAGPADTSRCFTLGSYNILADYPAQRDYGSGRVSWLTADQLSLSSRHKRLIEELVYLDEDVICLQEVGGDYMDDMLQPTLER